MASGGTISTTVRAAVVILILVVGLLALSEMGLLPSLPNPLESDEVERDVPTLLQSLEDESSYTAATGNFQTDVDVEQDARYLPDFLKGERVVLRVTGGVDAVVDFSDLTVGQIEVDGDSLTITLPPPTLEDARIDHDATEVISRDRGLLDRIEDVFRGDPVDDAELYRTAEDQLEEAALESELTDRARENTRRFLRELFGDVGYDDVTVVFSTPANERT